MIVRMLVQTFLMLAVMGVMLLGVGGDWHWPQAWVFLLEVGVLSLVIGWWLAQRDPVLLMQRLSSPMQRDQRMFDRIFMTAFFLLFFSWFILMALDAKRFARSHVPAPAEWLGAILIALCMGLSWWTFAFNTFAVPQIRIQAERHQHVVSEGPYRFVRHPLYASTLFFFVGVPLLLGSWWGLTLAPLFTVVLGARAIGEEDLLREELAGYEAYIREVRFRLVPGIW